MRFLQFARPLKSQGSRHLSLSLSLCKMANQLKVEELRTQLAQRCLSTTGTKPTLVRRLEAALRKEKKQQTTGTDGDASTNKKRQRDSENGDSSVPGKIKAIEKLRGMGIRQLRELAAHRGVSETGSKKEILERLCEDSDDQDLQEIPQGKSSQEENESKNEKIVTVTKKGAAVLDQWLPDHIKAHYHVLQLGDEIYDAMLNQTNVGDNNNKFYVIQVLESDSGGAFMVYNRWGRVGVKGQDKLQGPYTSRDIAIREFGQKFFAKTKNEWSNRKDFIFHPKFYTWLEMEYTEDKESDVKENLDSSIGTQPRETQLEPRIARFISLVCNVSMMKQQMMEIGYNADKLPLGKLSKSTILKGYDVLKRIADVIGKSNRKKLEELSGEFYTVIPHDFGFRKMREFVIDSPQKLKHKLEMVEALAEIEVATKLLKDDTGIEDDPLYSHYRRLHCELTPIGVDSKEFHMNTHAKSHSNYDVDIVQIFRVSREGEPERFKKFSSTKNRMLLWHGSRLTNWTGILSQGLRIAPPEAPVTGYMFGKGVYFADMFSKSANYCYATHAAKPGVLLLCEVALGDMAELLNAKYDADKLPEGKLSTKGVGGTAPDLSEAHALEDGVVVPLGKPKEQLGHQGALLYNEYIVYNVDQIRMRYVIQVNFNFM
ncbi:poly [ADP-ribose] polymerase 2 isoform X2 [Juglans microcarpa x Juglans regia]|uniref:poly [ADP-ribose] polymerase 2 isoform X2 n=1 Tax=Juglans microcarpa x Juglans regia TaxID=2249226 RepID=UPI001B7F265B|nr:poly [ADP-ribose] polymerase 2 isoform X2 [Juglans microcarpa x Juglans regia]